LIQAPFVLEGMVQGLAAGALSLCALWGTFAAVRSEIPTLAGFLAPLAQPRFLDWPSVALLLALGWILGAAASLFSLRRFTKKWIASR
jgi:cell division transport system permease protein